MIDFSSYEFYINKDGTTNEFAAFLNCLQAGLYFALKVKKGIENPFELFVKDPSYTVDFNLDGTFRDVSAVHNWGCFEVFQTEDVKGRGRDTLREIEQLLDQGEIVIYETYIARTPFFERFVSLNAYFDEALHLTPYNHLFVAVGYTDKHLIYVESPHLLTSNHVPYNNSRSIGMIDKDILQYAIDCFLNYRRIHIKEEGLIAENRVGRVVSTLQSMLDTSLTAPSELTDYERYYGSEGIDKLIDCIQSGTFLAGTHSKLHESLHDGEVLLWKFRNLKQQQCILYHCIQRNRDHFGEDALPLLNALNNYMDKVEILVGKLRIMQIKKKYHQDGLVELLVKIKDNDSCLLEVIARWASRNQGNV